jgi:MinD-like ATPase involved in chromosome partitioning or flagellar assembly
MTPDLAAAGEPDFDVVPLVSLEPSASVEATDSVDSPLRDAAASSRARKPPPDGGPERALQTVTLAPDGGWRRALWQLTRSRVNLVSVRDRHLVERAAVLRRPLWGPWAIAVMSGKGGVGKTTVCASLGHVFAAAREDRVIAVEFNPHGGTLAQRVGQQTRCTISDLLASTSRFERYDDVAAFTSAASSRLQVLAADRDPSRAQAVDIGQYRRVRAILGIHHSLLLLDCGTGLLTDASRAALEVADQLVIVTSDSLDAAEVSYRTLEWLDRRGRADLVRDAVVAVNALEQDRRIRVEVIERAFAAHCRAVVRVPRDRHLRMGTRIEFDGLEHRTRDAWVELAATLAEGFRL